MTAKSWIEFQELLYIRSWGPYVTALIKCHLGNHPEPEILSPSPRSDQVQRPKENMMMDLFEVAPISSGPRKMLPCSP